MTYSSNSKLENWHFFWFCLTAPPFLFLNKGRFIGENCLCFLYVFRPVIKTLSVRIFSFFKLFTMQLIKFFVEVCFYHKPCMNMSKSLLDFPYGQLILPMISYLCLISVKNGPSARVHFFLPFSLFLFIFLVIMSQSLYDGLFLFDFYKNFLHWTLFNFRKKWLDC